MIIVAMLIHLLSAAIFALGIVLMLAVGWQADVTDAHVAATVALLGLNVAVHYFRVALEALESDASDVKLSHEQQRERMRQQVRERDETSGRPATALRVSETDKPQAIVEAEQRHSQALAEAERNIEWRDD